MIRLRLRDLLSCPFVVFVSEVGSSVPSGMLVSTLGSGMFVSGTGMVVVSVGIVVGAVVGLVVGAFVVAGVVVDGFVAGAALSQAQAQSENAVAIPKIKTRTFFIMNPPFVQIAKVVFPVLWNLDRKRIPFERSLLKNLKISHCYF